MPCVGPSDCLLTAADNGMFVHSHFKSHTMQQVAQLLQSELVMLPQSPRRPFPVHSVCRKRLEADNQNRLSLFNFMFILLQSDRIMMSLRLSDNSNATQRLQKMEPTDAPIECNTNYSKYKLSTKEIRRQEILKNKEPAKCSDTQTKLWLRTIRPII